jgi:WD40 repeat protein
MKISAKSIIAITLFLAATIGAGFSVGQEKKKKPKYVPPFEMQPKIVKRLDGGGPVSAALLLRHLAETDNLQKLLTGKPLAPPCAPALYSQLTALVAVPARSGLYDPRSGAAAVYAIGPQRKYLAYRPVGGSTIVYELASGKVFKKTSKPLFGLGVGGKILSKKPAGVLSPDGSMLVRETAGQIAVFDPSGKTERYRIDPPIKSWGELPKPLPSSGAFGFSADGKWLIARSFYKTVGPPLVYAALVPVGNRVPRQTILWQVKKPEDAPVEWAMASDGQHFLWLEGKTIVIGRLAPEITTSLILPDVKLLATSPSENLFIASGRNGVFLYDVDGQTRKISERPNDSYGGAVFTTDGEFFALAQKSGFSLYQTEDLSMLQTYPVPNCDSALSFSSDRGTVYCAGRLPEVDAWHATDLETGERNQIIATFPFWLNQTVPCYLDECHELGQFAFSNKRLLSGNDGAHTFFDLNRDYKGIILMQANADLTRFGAYEGGTISVWNDTTSKTEWQSSEQDLLSFDIHPTLPEIAIGQIDNTVKVVNFATGKTLMNFRAHSYEVNSVSYIGRGDYLATASTWPNELRIIKLR